MSRASIMLGFGLLNEAAEEVGGARASYSKDHWVLYCQGPQSHRDMISRFRDNRNGIGRNLRSKIRHLRGNEQLRAPPEVPGLLAKMTDNHWMNIIFWPKTPLHQGSVKTQGIGIVKLIRNLWAEYKWWSDRQPFLKSCSFTTGNEMASAQGDILPGNDYHPLHKRE